MSSRTVYFGRIPFDYTEEQVGELARSVGPVSAVRLMFDKDTGKSKGFAFVEYVDKESAGSAVRNLNNYAVGNQHLKVDYSNNDHKSSEDNGSLHAIARLIAEMKNDDKTTFLAEFKKFSKDRPEESHELLANNPQFAYAVVQTMIDLNRIDQKLAEKTLLHQSRASKDNFRKRDKSSSPTPIIPPGTASGPSPHATEAVAAAVASASAPAPTSLAPVPIPAMDEAQKQMIMQVMSFTDEQLDSLPPDQYEAVMDIRTRVQNGQLTL